MLPLLAGVVVVRALMLPPHSTVDPFGARPLMAASRTAVAATVTVGGFVTRVVVWDRRGRWHYVAGPRFARTPASTAQAVAAFDPDGALLINAAAVYDGAMVETSYRPQRVVGKVIRQIDFSSCHDPAYSAGAKIAGRYRDGDAIATMQSPAVVDLDDLSGAFAPVTVRLRGEQCAYLGNGYAIGTAGMYAAGYAGYVGNVPQASDVAVKQRFIALRWHGDQRRQLGPGAAMAVAADATVVGADTLPGPGADFGGAPHARMWSPSGTPTDLFADRPLSVAYAIDARDRIAGMCEGPNHRHYAFLWSNGRAELLDDVAGEKAAGWRFEAVYAFAPDGSLVGIGTLHGVATAFEISGL